MRKLIALVLGTMLVGLMGSAGSAPMDSMVKAGPGPGGYGTDNVEWIKNLVISQDAVGGRIVGKYLYANDQNKIMIFNIKDPVNPALESVIPMPQEFELNREDIDTNGEIMVIPNTVTASADGKPRVGANALYIIDVEDKSNPKIISTLPGAAQHTFSCVLDCKWAYGSDGNIVDLRNPAKPKLLKEKWTDGTPAPGGGHDVEEVAPGMILTATQPIMLLDVKKKGTPADPKVLAIGRNVDGRFIHSGRWPQNGKDKFLLMGGEKNLTPRCAEDPSRGAVMTWDASDWKKTGTFKMIDEYYAKNGTYVDGNPPANPGIGGCSSHWLEAHPKFRNGGIFAAAFFQHGIRFFDVDSKGKMKEVGYFLPYAGEAGAVYWANDEILYVMDYYRGIDILRWKGGKS